MHYLSAKSLISWHLGFEFVSWVPFFPKASMYRIFTYILPHILPLKTTVKTPVPWSIWEWSLYKTWAPGHPNVPWPLWWLNASSQRSWLPVTKKSPPGGMSNPVRPGSLTWTMEPENMYVHPWKRKIIFQTIIFRFYVNFRGVYVSISLRYPKTLREV